MPNQESSLSNILVCFRHGVPGDVRIKPALLGSHSQVPHEF